MSHKMPGNDQMGVQIICLVRSNPSKRTNSHELFGIIMVLYIDRREVNMMVWGEGGVLANKPPIIGNSVKWNLWFRLISLNWFALVGSADRTISRRMIGNSRRFGQYGWLFKDTFSISNWLKLRNLNFIFEINKCLKKNIEVMGKSQ